MRRKIGNRTSEIAAVPFVFSLFFLASCQSELIQKQAEELQRQQEEIGRQRSEIEELKLAQLREKQKREACNRAFHEFERAQKAKDPEDTIALYRRGLDLCPDDDVAHYELGKILIDLGRTDEAAKEFEAAVKLNPNFLDAQRLLEEIRNK